MIDSQSILSREGRKGNNSQGHHFPISTAITTKIINITYEQLMLKKMSLEKKIKEMVVNLVNLAEN